MVRRIGLASLLIAGLGPMAAGARAQATASGATTGSTSISAPAAISVTQSLSFNIQPQSLNTGLTITSNLSNGVNANVVLTGGQTASVSVPATFDVTRVGGDETITVRTVGAASSVTSLSGATQVAGVVNGGLFNNPVTVVGNLDNGVLSFSIGGAVTVANTLVPGEYQGVLTVIAQYN